MSIYTDRMLLHEATSIDTPDSGVMAIYVKADGNVYTKDDAGVERSASAPVSSVNGQTGAVVLNNTHVGAAATSHAHVINDVTGLQSALDGKSNTGHTHAIANVTGLSASLGITIPLANNFSVVSSNITVNVPGLTFAMVAGQLYYIIIGTLTGTGAGGTQLSVTHPNDSTGIVQWSHAAGANATGTQGGRAWANAAGTGAIINVASQSLRTIIHGHIRSATGGTFQLQFAQSTSNVTPSVLQANQTFLNYRSL